MASLSPTDWDTQRRGRGFVLLPRRWVVERSFAWMTRFRGLARDFERLPKTVAGLHFALFARTMLARCFAMLASSALVAQSAGIRK